MMAAPAGTGRVLLSILPLIASQAAAQTTRAVTAAVESGRLALGSPWLLAKFKPRACADKRANWMVRLPGSLWARDARRASPATLSAHATATVLPPHACRASGSRPARDFRIFPVPGMPQHLQYLSY